MLPTRNPEKTEIVTYRDRDFVLRPMKDEDAVTWAELQIEAGKVIAESLGSKTVERKHIKLLMLVGIKLASMALGGDWGFAASLDEAERKEIVEKQDRLNQTHLIEPYLAIEQTAARAYLQMPEASEA